MTAHPDWDDRDSLELDSAECLESSDDCAGPVELRTTGDSLRAWPRCEFHAERRQERYENSMERYASSTVAPSWFDPSYAGERWNEDDPF